MTFSPSYSTPPTHLYSSFDPETLIQRYRDTRLLSMTIAKHLSDEDMMLQSMTDASPTKWHLGHTTWFFETFICREFISNYRLFDASFLHLFNSYYNGVGTAFSRPHRGLLSRPALTTVLDYRCTVDDAICQFLERNVPSKDCIALLEMGIHHEQQHQELIFTDIKHALFHNPTFPAFTPLPARLNSEQPAELNWISFDDGMTTIGHEGQHFAYDNETPAHSVFLPGFKLASRLTTNGEYLAFIQDGGYQNPLLWLSDGWATLCAKQKTHPLYWVFQDDSWHEFTLGGLVPLALDLPVTHLSQYEAHAFSLWAGHRLATEFEWEKAAQSVPVRGAFLDFNVLSPSPAQNTLPIQQLYGDTWEWTSSSYLPYPGFKPFSGKAREYNGKFMSNQSVLRGGSCVTPQDHIRPTYRNFFPASTEWQFSGIRLASDL